MIHEAPFICNKRNMSNAEMAKWSGESIRSSIKGKLIIQPWLPDTNLLFNFRQSL